MVAMSEEFRRRWEAERVRREEAELVELARLFIALFGHQAQSCPGNPFRY